MSKKPEQLQFESTRLHDAASSGRVGAVKLLLEAGAQVDSRDKNESTSLHKAASGGHVDVTKLLLQAKAQVDSRDEFESTPIHKAASGGHVGVVDLLLKKGAQPESKEEIGDTPLHKAASGGHVGVAELLLKAGARVDSRDENKSTPLHKAASGGHVGVVELLLLMKAQVDSREKVGETPLHKAAARGHVGVAELLLEAGARVDSKGWSKSTPIHQAASGGHVGVFELLLKAGAQVNNRDRSESTLLHEAASGGHIGVVKLLLGAKVQVDSRDTSESTSLHKAASGGHVDVVELLLEAGAQVDSRDMFESTPLQLAASGGHKGVVELLLYHGAQVDSRDTSESTSLHKAAARGHFDVAELLLEAGARVDSRDKVKSTPLHKAASGGHVRVAEVLLKKGAQVDSRDETKVTPLYNAASGGHVGAVGLLLGAGAQVDSKSETRDTPLHKAASGGHVGVAKLLIEAGARVGRRDARGSTPLHMAASEGNFGVAELLLNAGAPMGSVDKDGKTPKDRAKRKDVPAYCSSMNTFNILEGRKIVLELLTSGRVTRYKLNEDGGKLQTMSCTVSVPPGALAMETELICQVVSPDAITLPLAKEILVSNIIQLGPQGTIFQEPVTVQMQYSTSSSPAVTWEPAMWVTEDKSKWTTLKTMDTEETQLKDTLAVSVDHFSIFAVVSQLKQDRFLVPTRGCALTSSTHPTVQIIFPKQSVTSQMEVVVQVQDISRSQVEDIKKRHESSCGLISTSPFVKVETVGDSIVKFNEPVTVRVPHPQHYMDIQDEAPAKVKVLSCEKGADDWIDMADGTNRIRVTQTTVEFEVTHFTRWIVINVKDRKNPQEKFGSLEIWEKLLQSHSVQFFLLQPKDELRIHELVIDCALEECADEICRCTKSEHGYTGPLPTHAVNLYEGQKVDIVISGNVSVMPGSERAQSLTFHSRRKTNRVQMQVIGMESEDRLGVSGKGFVQFFAVPQVDIDDEEKFGEARRLTKHQPSSGEGSLKPEYLCMLPITVPCENSKKTKEASDSHTGVGNYFDFVKNHVATDWKDLAVHLEIEDHDIRNIAGRNRDDKSSCQDMLWEWRKWKGSTATIKVLMKALSEANLHNVVDGLREKYPELASL